MRPSRRIRIGRWLTVVCLAAGAISSWSGCRGPAARGNTARTRAVAGETEEAPKTDPSESELETKAAIAAAPLEKAEALVALGRSQIAAGEPRKALKSFYAARRAHYEGQVASEINHGIGESYFWLGEHSLARRYLAKALEDSSSEDRDLILAKLVVSNRELNDVAQATALRGRIPRPYTDEVRRILSLRRAPRGDSSPASSGSGESEAPPIAVRPPVVRPESEPGAVSPSNDDDILVLSRASWNARAPRKNIEPMGHVEKITVHHTGGDLFWDNSRVETAAEIRKIQRYHQHDQGWADIGYHYIVDRSGVIWQGRRLRYQGAHARGSGNYGNVGIVVLGNYMYQGITPAQRRSLEILIEKLSDYFRIAPHDVYTHREITSGKTDCPGPSLTRCVNEIRSGLRRRLVAYRP